jgi:riboflavin kinase/FMN adenylyltransferase
MIVIDWAAFLKSGLPLDQKLSSITVGIFDGVHRGHQALIKRIVSYNTDYVPVVVTFKQNHKINTVKKFSENTSRGDAETQRRREELGIGDIISFEQKTKILEDMGVGILLVIDFTESFRQMSGIEFLEIILKHGNVGFMAIGSQFRCGCNLDTDAAAILKFFTSHSIPLEIVPEVMEGSLPISSSRIRSCIANGDLELAEKMLNRSC